VCKLKKALYGLKHGPRAWYSRLDKYLQHVGFIKGSAYTNLYIKVTQDSILLIEVYVDDCWCNYLHNILPNINYQLGFVISRVDALYVPIIDRFLCLFSI
jgi:hypothetical protein